jgi:hypothetical protein
MGLVQIAGYSTRVQADVARLLLEADGFDVLLFDTEMNYTFGAMMPIRLLVPDDQTDGALRVLEAGDML